MTTTFRTMMVATVAYASIASLVWASGEELDPSIQRNRVGTLVIHASPNVDIEVEQLRHEFWFGCALSSRMFIGRARSEDVAKYRELFLANFNAAVTENALKWAPMEPQRGQINYAIVDAILDWADHHDIPVRGHCIFWGTPGRVQDWVKQLDDTELLDVLRSRAHTLARRYRGRFAEYDLNNEMMHANYYQQRLGIGITKKMAMWVRGGDPDAKLFVNDYDVLTGNRLDDYVAHVRGLLEQGVPLDGIGVQGHLHGGSFDPGALKHALDTLATLDLPIRVTEFNMPGQRSRFSRDRRRVMTAEDEEAKARALVQYYRVCFAHPAVHGILMWGFWEGANWIPASSLYRRDWTPTPAAHAYRDLVFNQWWTKWKGKTDSQGKCTVAAFYGQHRVTAGGTSKTVELRSADGEKRIVFP